MFFNYASRYSQYEISAVFEFLPKQKIQAVFEFLPKQNIQAVFKVFTKAEDPGCF